MKRGPRTPAPPSPPAPTPDAREQLARKAAEISALREISRAISAATDLDTTLTLITRRTADVMRMDSCSIYLLDAQREYLVLKATTGLAPEAVGHSRLRVGEGLTGWAAEHGQAVASTNAAADPRFKYLPETRETLFQSLLAVPLSTGGKILGAINVQTTGTHEYTEDEVELLSIISDMASGALEKARLYDSMRRQIMELSTLAEVSETLTSPLYLEQILRLLVEMAARVFHAPLCTLLLQDGEELVLAASHPEHAGPRPRQTLRQGEGLPGLAVESGQPVMSTDLAADPRFHAHELPGGAYTPHVRSMLAVPLRVRDRTLGVVNCYTDRRHEFTQAETNLLQTLANQTALAIENAGLVVKSAMVREMHHRVKNNLQMIAMLLRLQIRDGREVSGREVLTETINRILSIAAVHEILAAEGLRQVAIRAMLERVVQTVTQTMAPPHFALDARIEGDDFSLPSQQATSLALVVNELLQNAMEHAFPGRSAGRVVITLSEGREAIRVEVRDDGIGLPEGFSPGRSADLGLQIVRTLVQDDLKGQLSLTNVRGVRAVITMPRPQGS
ncbi:MAG TPA: GAF domain-containing protein [bacterium]|nr:GAF domain-containing protein [bacterium]